MPAGEWRATSMTGATRSSACWRVSACLRYDETQGIPPTLRACRCSQLDHICVRSLTRAWGCRCPEGGPNWRDVGSSAADRRVQTVVSLIGPRGTLGGRGFPSPTHRGDLLTVPVGMLILRLLLKP